MLCDNCGKILPDSAQVCDECGKWLAGRDTSTGGPSSPGAATPPPLPSTPPPPPQPHGHHHPMGHPPYQQQPYQGNPYQQHYPQGGYNETAPVVSVGEWMLMDLILIIPIVNIIMLFVWSFGNTNPNRRNKARSSLLWIAVAFGSVFILGLLGGLGAAMSSVGAH
ncbi:MAG: hypothetical protein LBJ46_10300 [Planctomycetota bacterium]|nr:hypothetical protein [Planctomycetota bacterium]